MDSVEVFHKSDDYLSSLEQAIQSAQDSIYIEMYIFEWDDAGKYLLQLLSAANKRDVRIFIRIDGIGSLQSSIRLKIFCKKHNLALEVYHPSPFATLNTKKQNLFYYWKIFLYRWRILNRRTHRKIILIDNHIAYIGGRNIHNQAFSRFAGESAWEDSSILLKGKICESIFEIFWFYPFRTLPIDNLLFNYSLQLRRKRWKFIRDKIKSAQKRIWISSPYLMPTPQLQFALRKASKKGIDVKIITTELTDVLISKLAAEGLFKKLLKWNVHLFYYREKIYHRKLLVIDDMAISGSANLNSRSLLHDLEVEWIADNGNESSFIKQYESDLKHSREVNRKELESSSFLKNFASWLASWLSYWL
ncbi:MAG: phosphatidylserine/phosphatidylglycerophosphate/cardiolipin synthase family protein [Oligoflexia bacterium]|nr:phosphatidylserine/phosphatidylglycerophosphate/cardiolipin synthase family protein [Oligoflexia bacterium]